MLRRSLCVRGSKRASLARPFFSFANPLKAHDSFVKSHQETKVVPFSPEEMYDVVADVDRYNEFLPFCVDSKVLRRPNENVMEASLRIGFKVFAEAYTSRVIMKRPEKIVIKAIESPTFKRIDSEWVFRRLPDPNTCEINFKVTFEVASFFHANAMELFFEDVALTQVNAFIGRTAKLQSMRRMAEARANSQRPTTPTPTSAASSPTPPPTRSSSTATTTTMSSHLSPAAQRAVSIVREDVWSQDYQHLEQAFRKHAVDDDKLYFAGFVKACRQLGYLHQDLQHISENSALAGAIFSSFESSKNPKDFLSLEEFAVGVYLMTKGTVEEKAHTLFHLIDSGGDGKISRDELRDAMERRIRTVRKIFPKLLKDQVQLQMESANVSALNVAPDEAMSRGLSAIETLMEEIEQEIPLAVNQIFLEADLDQDDYITQGEWLFAWQVHPEFVELMTIDGMKKVAQWASVVHEDDGEDNDGKQEADTRLTHVD